MSTDFMQNSTNAVERLLDAGRTVVVFSGQLDIIVDTLATENWMNNLRWKHINAWKNTDQQSIRGPRETTANEFSFQTDFAYRKQYQNLDYWRILYAGHMCPLDNPVMSYEMLKSVISQ
jgi:serine carboxypeptidase 1